MRLLKVVEDETIGEVEVDSLYIDGYDFGDRLLENLLIKITLNQEKNNIVITADWPEGLDEKYWTMKAMRYCQDMDMFSTNPDLDDYSGFIEEDPEKD